MTDATIIPFPARPNAEEERLRLALQSLQTALDEQRRALSDWRFSITELGIGVAGLGHSLGSYHDALAGVEGKLGDLREQSLRLERWANGALDANANAAHAGDTA